MIGMGESKTPNSFIAACNKFKYLDILSAADEEEGEEELGKRSSQKKAPAKKSAPQKKAEKEQKADKEQKVSQGKKAQEPVEEPRTSLRTIRRALRTMVRENSGRLDKRPGFSCGEKTNSIAFLPFRGKQEQALPKSFVLMKKEE